MDELGKRSIHAVMMNQAMDIDAFASAQVYKVAVDRLGAGEWGDLINLFDDSTLYQTWAYGAVNWGQSNLSHLVMRQDGDPVAVVQVRLVLVPLLRKGIAYIRSGPLWRRKDRAQDAEMLGEVMRALVEEYSERRGLSIRLVPSLFQEDDRAAEFLEIAESVGFREVDSPSPYRSIRLDLSRGLEEIRKGLAQKWRNQLNRAERNELKVSEGADEVLFEKFLAIYDEMMKRKRFTGSIDPRDFAIMQKLLSDREKMVIMVAQRGNVMLAGAVASKIGETGIYLHGATSDEGMKSKGSYLLQWRMIQRLREEGCRWYDLGGINPQSNPGVYHFKQGMGGQKITRLCNLEHRGCLLSRVSVGAADRMNQAARFLRSVVDR